MSKILAFAEEIDKQFREKDDQIRNLTEHAGYLECELNKEKARNAEFKKDLMLLLSKYSSDEWHSW
jgi:hypothetical protein